MTGGLNTDDSRDGREEERRTAETRNGREKRKGKGGQRR